MFHRAALHLNRRHDGNVIQETRRLDLVVLAPPFFVFPPLDVVLRLPILQHPLHGKVQEIRVETAAAQVNQRRTLEQPRHGVRDAGSTDDHTDAHTHTHFTRRVY